MKTNNALKNNMFLKMLVMMAVTAMMISIVIVPEQAEAKSLGKPFSNYSLEYPRERSTSLVTADEGYMRVCNNQGSTIYIEYYDTDFKLLKKKTIKMELPIWGGFYKGTDGYYIVEGKYNTKCVNGTEVIRIIKYDTSWNRIGAGSICAKKEWGHEIRYPFDAGCVDIVETDGDIYIATGHEGYVDKAINRGHQGLLLVRMNKDTLDTEVVNYDLYHSFSQRLAVDGDDLYLYEESEGSRATTLTQFDISEPGEGYNKSIEVLKYGGKRTDTKAVDTYATADDVAISNENVLGIGQSMDQSKYYKLDEEKDPYNIYLTVTPRSDLSEESTTVKWLTDYKDKPVSFIGTSLTKINDNKFLVTWEKSGASMKYADRFDSLSEHTLHYMFLDGNGNKISKEYKARIAYSDCHPIVVDNKVVYCASDCDCVDFYAIDIESGAVTKRVYPIASGFDPYHIFTVSVRKISNKTYTGKTIKPDPVIKANGKTLKKGVDYTLTYTNNKRIGNAKITIKGMGEYHGKTSVTFKIVPKSTKLSKVSAGKKTLTVRWKKQTRQTSGYQIQYTTDKHFKKGKKTITVKGSHITIRRIYGLKSRKTYNVRVRTYKIVNGKKYCSAWSEIKMKKTR